MYAVVSSSISFWIPCTIMVFTYYQIFKEANRQEKQVSIKTFSDVSPVLAYKKNDNGCFDSFKTFQLAARHGAAMLIHHRSSGGNTNGEALSASSKTLTLHEPDTDHTPTKDKNLMKIRREHKVN